MFIRSLCLALALLPASLWATPDLMQVQSGEIGKIRILSNNNLPKKVIVVRNYSTKPFVNQLIETVREINSSSDKLDLKVHVIVGSSSEARSFRSQLQAQGDLDTLVEVNDRFYTSDQWMQDWGEIAVADIKDKEGPQMLILDSNRGRGLAGLPKIFADLWDAYYIKNPRRGVKGDYGGNIEVSPDNVLVLGTTSSPEMRALLGKHGYTSDKMALLDTHWLQVGHVDEYVTFVPTEGADGGYTILKSDPILAFDLIKNATEEQLNQTNPDYRSTVRQLHADLNSGQMMKMSYEEYDLSPYVDILKSANNNKDSRTTRERLNRLIDLNRAIGRLINENVEKLRAKILEVTGTPDRDIKVISLPTIFRGSKSGSSLYRCVALLPGVVNMLVLGDQLVIPDAQMPMLNDFIEKQMAKLKLTSHFLDDMAYHNLAGEIHCGTNLVREHDDYWVVPEHIILKKKFNSLFGLK